jgi:peptidoglycan/xylan/chitin deacetylase (PgdA/CDA1 family)
MKTEAVSNRGAMARGRAGGGGSLRAIARFVTLHTPMRKLLFKRVATKKPAVAITFDDGPHPQFTPLVLDTLKRHGAHATFFLIGKNAREHPELVKRIAAEGHSLGCHTDTHADLSRLSYGAALAECRTAKNSIEEISGASVRFLRPPWGKLSPMTLPIALRSGMRIALWSLDSEDYLKLPPDEIADRLRNAHPTAGEVLLFHDDADNSARALPRILSTLAAHGLRGCAIEEL